LKQREQARLDDARANPVSARRSARSVVNPARPAAGGASFVELKLPGPEPSTAIEIVRGDGMLLRVPRGADQALLGFLLAALGLAGNGRAARDGGERGDSASC
jgi:hypothetical protein